MGRAYGYGKTDPWVWKGTAGPVASPGYPRSYGLGLPVYGAVYDEVTFFVTAGDIETGIGGKMSKEVKTVEYVVNLTQADIDGGCRSKASNCPGALAINRTVAHLGLYSSVGAFATDFYDEPAPLQGFEDGRMPVHTIDNPGVLKMFVPLFDGGGSVYPVKFTIELPADLRFYKLTLSGKEADTLSVILANVGGHPQKGPRQHAQSLAGKLRAAGVTSGVDDRLEEHGLREGHIIFSHYGTPARPFSW